MLAEDATFSSPVADYHGRDRAAHLLATIATVLDSVHQTRQWTDGPQGIFAFAARFADEELQGCCGRSSPSPAS